MKSTFAKNVTTILIALLFMIAVISYGFFFGLGGASIFDYTIKYDYGGVFTMWKGISCWLGNSSVIGIAIIGFIKLCSLLDSGSNNTENKVTKKM